MSQSTEQAKSNQDTLLLQQKLKKYAFANIAQRGFLTRAQLKKEDCLYLASGDEDSDKKAGKDDSDTANFLYINQFDITKVAKGDVVINMFKALFEQFINMSKLPDNHPEKLQNHQYLPMVPFIEKLPENYTLEHILEILLQDRKAGLAAISMERSFKLPFSKKEELKAELEERFLNSALFILKAQKSPNPEQIKAVFSDDQYEVAKLFLANDPEHCKKFKKAGTVDPVALAMCIKNCLKAMFSPPFDELALSSSIASDQILAIIVPEKDQELAKQFFPNVKIIAAQVFNTEVCMPDMEKDKYYPKHPKAIKFKVQALNYPKALAEFIQEYQCYKFACHLTRSPTLKEIEHLLKNDANFVKKVTALPAEIEPPKEVKLNTEVKDNQDKTWVHKTENFKLLNVHIGEPNRKAASPSHVLYQGQRGDNCHYYAMKRTAMFCEKDFVKKQAELERQAASGYRKAQAKLSNKFGNLKAFIEVNLGNQDPNKTPKSAILSELNNFLFLMKLAGQNSENYSKLSNLEIEQFLNDYKSSYIENIMVFLKFVQIKADNQTKIDFLEKLKFTEAMARSESKLVNEKLLQLKSQNNQKSKPEHEQIIKGLNEEDQKEFSKNLILRKMVDQELAKIFNLEHTSWKPTDPIEVLDKLLETNAAPLPFSGWFGECFYKPNTKFHHTDMYQYQIFGWKTENYIGKPAANAAHTINVIGVQISKKEAKQQEINPNAKAREPGFVYFIDPTDKSDPKTGIFPGYFMPYSLFCANVINGIFHLVETENKYGLQRKKM